MKLLLDENLPHDLRHFLPGHEVMTVAYLGWQGIENGALLTKAATNGFDAPITKDAGMQYEQNLAALPLAVVLLRAPTNTLDDIRPLVPQLLQALESLQPESLTRIG